MDYKNILYGALFVILGQAVVWIQINGQLIWQWAKDWRWPLMLLGVPIAWIYMEGTRYLVKGFNGDFWPSRFISFSMGILIFTLFTWLFRGVQSRQKIPKYAQIACLFAGCKQLQQRLPRQGKTVLPVLYLPD